MEPKFDVRVKLVGRDGNPFAILGRVKEALRKAGATPEQVRAFITEATSGNYGNLLATCCKWVHVA